MILTCRHCGAEFSADLGSCPCRRSHRPKEPMFTYEPSIIEDTRCFHSLVGTLISRIENVTTLDPSCTGGDGLPAIPVDYFPSPWRTAATAKLKEAEALLKAELANLQSGLPVTDGTAETHASAALQSIFEEVQQELQRAIQKFPLWPTDPLHAFAVVGEECGEAQREALQLVYEPHKSTPESLKQEVLQLAAMCFRFLLSTQRYDYKPCAQHAQEL